MSILTGIFAGLFLYLEIIYHLSGFGLSRCAPIYTIALIITWSGIWSLVVGLLRGIWKKIVFFFVIWFAIVWTGAQLVYLRIFKQPLLWEGIFRGGQDALTNYWREALDGIVHALPFLLLMVLPGIVIGILKHRKKWELPDFSGLQILRINVIICVGVVGEIVTLEVGKMIEADYYESYMDFYDPLSVAESMGVFPMLQRDTGVSVMQAVANFWEYGADYENRPGAGNDAEDGTENSTENSETSSETESFENTPETGEVEESTAEETSETGAEEPEPSPVPQEHEANIDFEVLRSMADDDRKVWLADYIEGQTPSVTNEYTGIFEGYNLIYLTAEGFSPYAVREDLTPTLYRLVNSGFVFENYYVPLWQTSTSDGEYINCTAMIPDGQFSMRKSGSNAMPYTLANFFKGEGAIAMAYHNNSLSYYDRYVTHPNLGYDFKGCRLGKLSQEEWGDKIFPMENPDAWPASDLEMMQGTIPEYINNDRFHAYYMTVSAHMNYNFSGNAMSAKNKEAVAGLEMSENARAYIASNIELDKALEYLLQQLEAAGKLDKTVICMSADHYPYGMSQEQYEELAGKSLSEGMDMYRNNLILWNSQMEEEPVYIDKACGSMDIVPTLLNLFGFSYDSRMYAGRDILSDEEGLVIFNDRSFVTDSVIYKKKGKDTIWLTDEAGAPKVSAEQQEAYLDEKKKEVKDRYQFSAYVLQTNYYNDILAATAEESGE